jgi:hypothetical protein
MFRTHTLTAALALAALSLPAAAQSFYVIDALGGAGPAAVDELTGGPGPGPCAYPAGPVLTPTWPAVGGPCPGPGAIAGGWPGVGGDIAVGKLSDTVFVGGPAGIAEYDRFGMFIGGIPSPLPGPITGLGFDSSAGMLWVTNGADYAGVMPGCAGLAVPVVGPFPVPLVGSPMTDMSWDPTSGSLWGCFADGRVAHFPVGGAPVCVFSALAVGLGLPLTGIAMDTTTPGFGVPTKVVGVTDGLTIARIDVGTTCAAAGVFLAPPTFAFPTSMIPVVTGPTSGLAYAAHGTTFGTGSGPEILYKGHSVVPSANTISLIGASVGTAGLFLDFTALCPPLMFKGLPLHVFPAIVIGPLPHGGTATLPAALPVGTPIGVEIMAQFYNKPAGAGVPWESTPGLVLTTALP